MIKKRLIGVVTVKAGQAVQSFQYSRHLPLGRPEVLVENLDRWGADEILLQCVDRAGLGPDLLLLERIGRMGLSTPLIYAGGIRHADDGRRAIQTGADRICVDALLHDDLPAVVSLSEQLGAQALIAALPLSVEAGGLRWRDHRSGQSKALHGGVLELLSSGVVSETLVIDWRHEGQPGGFDPELLDRIPSGDFPLIAFGGLSEAAQLRAVLDRPRVVAAAVGNFLAYREHAIQHLKTQLSGVPLRPASYLQANAL